MQDLTIAVRALLRRPAFTLIALATLALGIGANAAIFSLVDTVLLRRIPFADPDRLVMPWQYNDDLQRRLGFDRLPASPGDVNDFVTRNTTFEDLASMRSDRVNITGGGEPERVGGVRVSRNFFRTLGVQPVLGRSFAEADGTAGPVVLIGHGLWQRRFGGEDVVGRSMSLNGTPATIIGVLPPWFRFPSAAQMPSTMGLAQVPEIWSLDLLDEKQKAFRGGKSFAMVGRLRAGVSAANADAELNTIAEGIAREFPLSNAGWKVRVLPLREQLVGGVRTALVVLLAAVGCVLLIACTNVANLLLVKAASRQREVAVRYALGADRWQILRQLLLESLVLAIAAGVLGLFVGWWGLRILLLMAPTELPIGSAALDWRVVGFTALLSLVTGLVFGAMPALQASRVDLVEGLRDGSRGAVGSRRAHRTRNVLVVIEVAIAAVLLIGASLLIQTFVRLVNVDTGVIADGVLTMEVAVPRTAYPGARASEFFERLVGRIAAVPGVAAVGAASNIPLMGAENLRQVTIEGRPRPDPGKEIIADFRMVTNDYFRTMGIPHVAGEPLPVSPAPGGPGTVLINTMMAESYFADENPIGRRIKLVPFDAEGPWLTVIGVVGDTRHTALDSVLRPQVYVHHQVDSASQMVVVLRTQGEPASYATVARAAVHELDPNQPVGRIRTMRTVVLDAVARQRFTMFLASTFASLALVLSLVGLYGVVSFSVAERTQELGVRLALGASPANLLGLVLLDGVKLVVAGVVIGVAGAFVLARFLETQLFGVDARDVPTYATVAILLVAAAIAGCLIPATRATRVNPMVSLRAD